MAGSAERALLDCRLVIVTGKGGCGKTTVATALALGAAERGKRVALVEMGRDEHCHQLLDPDSTPVGYAGRELQPSLWVFHIDPFQALAEYLGLQIGIQSLVERGLRQPAFQQLLAAAPGWRELITLGKVYHMESLTRDAGQPLYDLIVIDAPASGHGLTFLDVPRVVQSAIKTGPLRRNAGNVEALIQDPERTRLIPVSLAEELPVRETGELIDRVRSDIGIPIDRVVVNRVVPRPFGPGLEDLEARLEGASQIEGFEALPAPAVMARCCAWRRARYELGNHYVHELESTTGLPLVALEERAGGIDAPHDLLRMSRVLYGEPDLASEGRPA
ncbi:MAG: ArsA family ATPase [bacterium]|nr:ArsA family ATPase [bacterium]